MAGSGTVLIDTDVFSVVYLRRKTTDSRRDGWLRALEGRGVVIALQTRAEVLAGAFERRWGDDRVARLMATLDGAATVPPNQEVAESWARLRAARRATGHALCDKVHDGDRWVAATAVALDVPLLAGDGIYRGAPGVTLFEEGS
jgi:predicted nucleic acid-binding protein